LPTDNRRTLKDKGTYNSKKMTKARLGLIPWITFLVALD